MNLEEEIEAVKERNKRVEDDKAWELSFTRKLLILLIIYGIAWIVMVFIGISNPHFNAFIPTIGFFLSTLTLGFAKKTWIKWVYKND